MKRINISQYNTTEITLHKAVQLVAFLGMTLAEKQADDSHATVNYHPEKDALIGKPITINGKVFTAEFRLGNYNLALVSGEISNIFSIKGRTIPDVLEEVKTLMELNELPEFKMNYDLPEDYDLENYKIEQPSKEAIIEWTTYRQISSEIFEVVNTMISPPSPINIWPHHFDTGTYHPLGDTGAIGTGFAVADTIVNEPYFYIYGWAKDGTIDYASAPDLSFGEWKTGSWQGAIMPLSTVAKLPNLKADLTTFFEKTSQFLTKEVTV